MGEAGDFVLEDADGLSWISELRAAFLAFLLLLNFPLLSDFLLLQNFPLLSDFLLLQNFPLLQDFLLSLDFGNICLKSYHLLRSDQSVAQELLIRFHLIATSGGAVEDILKISVVIVPLNWLRSESIKCWVIKIRFSYGKIINGLNRSSNWLEYSLNFELLKPTNYPSLDGIVPFNSLPSFDKYEAERWLTASISDLK